MVNRIPHGFYQGYLSKSQVVPDHIDRVFDEVNEEAEDYRIQLLDFSQWADEDFSGDKLKQNIARLNNSLSSNGELVIQLEAKPSTRPALQGLENKARQAIGYPKLYVEQPGGEYKEAKLKLFIFEFARNEADNYSTFPDNDMKVWELTGEDLKRLKIFTYRDIEHMGKGARVKQELY